MAFKDKEAKTRAEQLFRKNCKLNCKLNCSTPYSPKLRALIQKVVKTNMEKYEGNLVRVKVDLDYLTLKVSRRVKKTSTWYKNVDQAEISTANMDLSKVRNMPTAGMAAGSEDTL